MQVAQLLRRGIAEGVAPAIAFAASRGDDPPSTWFAGRHTPEPESTPCDAATVFDLASLTKPLTTTLWCLRLVDAGELSLSDTVGRHVEVTEPALAEQPLWRLMAHTSGLPAHRDYHAGLGPHVLRNGRFEHARSALRRMLSRTSLEARSGDRELYSDLGFLLLEQVCESVGGPLPAAWPGLPGHGAAALHFRPVSAQPRADSECAATERCPWRDRLLQGEVHDDNCWTIGGVGGHAGLFGTLEATHGAARVWLRAALGDASGLGLPAALVAETLDRRWMHPRGTHVLGWDTPTPGASSSGTRFGRRAFGHLGFTGTSVWVDPDEEVVMTLLTNRVCPTRTADGIRQFRRTLHDEAWVHLRAGGERFT